MNISVTKYGLLGFFKASTIVSLDCYITNIIIIQEENLLAQ